MAEESKTEAEVMKLLNITKADLDELIAEGNVTFSEEGGQRKFPGDSVTKLRELNETRSSIQAGGIDLEQFDIVEDASLGDYISIEETMSKLGCSREKIDEMISQGLLSPISDAGTLKFQMADVKKLMEERKPMSTQEPSSKQTLNLEQALQELQCSRQELEALVAQGKLEPVKEGEETRYLLSQITGIRATREKGSTAFREGEPTMSEEEAIQELGISLSELNELVEEGKLIVVESADGARRFDPGEIFLIRRQLRPSTVYEGELYMGYDEALQELQSSRTELDKMISDGKLKPYREGEDIKFRVGDIEGLKQAMEKKPTMMEGKGGEGIFMMEEAEDVGLDSKLMDAEALKKEGTEQEETKEAPAEAMAEGARKDSDQTSVIPVAASADESGIEEESIFDFGEEDLDLQSSDSSVVDIKVDAGEQATPGAVTPPEMVEIGDGLGLDIEESDELIQIEDDGISSSEILPLDEESSDVSSADSDIMTDVLRVGDEESSQDDILGDLMDLEDSEAGTEAASDQITAAGIGETAEVTADITQLDDETYEGTDLSEVLGAEEEAAEAIGEQLGEGESAEEFAPGAYMAPVAYAQPMAMISGGMVVVMILATIIMFLSGLFVIDQLVSPDYSSGLTKWAISIVDAVGLL